MEYHARKFDHLLGATGFSDQLLKSHFTLYEGYVKNTNALTKELNRYASEGNTSSPAFTELKRRFSWEFNGMRLHELYFSNMKKGGSSLFENADLRKKITDDFGSWKSWEMDFRGVAGMRGIGWAALSYDALSDRLYNLWVTEHDAGHLIGASPILILDVFEHAYTLDYGIKRADYIDAFFNAIDWEKVQTRFGTAEFRRATIEYVRGF